MTPSTPLDTPQDRNLPTRVSNACERCRRNKSRCDPFRPCSLCVRANVECSSSSFTIPNSAPKRKRRRDQSPSSHQRRTSNVTSRSLSRSQEQDAPQSHDSSTRGIDVDIAMNGEGRRENVTDSEVNSAVGIASKICQLSNQGMLERTTSAIPGGDVYGRRPSTRLDRVQRRPISSILGYHLPPMDIVCTLLEEYFDSVHWFSLVIYEPRFRSEFESIQDGLAYPGQKAFLLLLTTVLGMGAWYKSQKSRTDGEYPDENWHSWALSLIHGAESQLADLMDQSSIASVQTCILLGSYYVYHGKPNLSFALLGATIKTAQAIGLHRQPLRGNLEYVEERKRVWWTIYTWDRFASITYGRPLGINDKDCNVTHPTDIYESPCFKANSAMAADSAICYSSYQRELNKLYLIASTIIETIFGIRTDPSNQRVAGHEYITQTMEVTKEIWAWRRRLPAHLLLDLNSDCEPAHSNTLRVHRLQALALQLTFDNLLIIFHRPLLAQQVDHLIKARSENYEGVTHSPSNLTNATSPSTLYGNNTNSPLSRAQAPSTEQWWDAALRTSRVTGMPQLAQMATDSHLVAFLAINMFNSAIVLAVMALSDPLSDRAQEAKRTITRIFRLQEVLGMKTKLSMQSNVVLKDVIHMLLRREADAILAPVSAPNPHTAGDGDNNRTPSDVPLMSVEDTLRLPIQLPMGTVNTRPSDQPQSNADKVLRLNESLASVQRAFPNGFDGVHNEGIANDEEWRQSEGAPMHSPEGHNDAWLHPDLYNFSADGDSHLDKDAVNVDAPGNGLYWFWDSAWNETCQ